jgi:HIRAN domain
MPWSEDSNVRHFHTKIVGVTHENADGTDRQAVIRKCRLFENLALDHEEDNPHDPNAVRVCRTNWQQLGYLNAGLAEEIVEKSGRGYTFAVFIKDLTGGQKGQSVGVNLLIVQAEPGVSVRDVKKYLKKLIRDDPELRGMKLKGGCAGKIFALAMALVVGVVIYLVLTRRK